MREGRGEGRRLPPALAELLLLHAPHLGKAGLSWSSGPHCAPLLLCRRLALDGVSAPPHELPGRCALGREQDTEPVRGIWAALCHRPEWDAGSLEAAGWWSFWDTRQNSPPNSHLSSQDRGKQTPDNGWKEDRTMDSHVVVTEARSYHVHAHYFIQTHWDFCFLISLMNKPSSESLAQGEEPCPASPGDIIPHLVTYIALALRVKAPSVAHVISSPGRADRHSSPYFTRELGK